MSNIIEQYKEAIAIVDIDSLGKDLKAIHKSGFKIKDLAQTAQFVFFMQEHYKTKDTNDSPDFKGFLKNSIEYATNFYKFCDEYNISPSVIPQWIKDLQDFALKLRTLSIKPANPASLPAAGTDISPASTTISLLTNPSGNTKTPLISAIPSYIENAKNNARNSSISKIVDRNQ